VYKEMTHAERDVHVILLSMLTIDTIKIVSIYSKTTLWYHKTNPKKSKQSVTKNVQFIKPVSVISRNSGEKKDCSD
jgi:hypothetical protein